MNGQRGEELVAGVGASRLARVQDRMAETGADALLLSVGPELPWLTGYVAMPLERLTMLVVTRTGPATLLVPRLEAPRVVERPGIFTVRPWEETEDPLELVTSLILPQLVGAGPAQVAVADRTWARFVLDLRDKMPANVQLVRAQPVVGPLRARKEPEEIDALRLAARAVDGIATALQNGEIPLVGRTEAAISADLGRRIVEAGHQSVNFSIVATAENAASPHHEPGGRIVRFGDVLLCDFGGTWPDTSGVGYCSDITRCVALGEPMPQVRRAYEALQDAHAAAVEMATVGTPASAVDAAARKVLESAGYGDRFIHRTGHGIGVEEHEDPYIVAGNDEPLEAGNTFSVEPGIYVPGAFGLRLEDIVVVTEDGPELLNQANRSLAVL